ncbi:MAG: CDP-diacylglycerol--glycerol-3-phosphate 3-phosphatidyltransferase [Marvinbryantia sp.]|jgi:CDP-diacylglycerol--glycerol-3-phosphate 3-phosphatidyltransferase
MNLPNKLTVIRMILIIPFVVLMMMGGDRTTRYVALAIFIIASVTDWFDGYLARKNHLVTNFGKFMDPLADKLLVCSAMICLVAEGSLPAWVVIIIISREFVISGFRLIASDNGIVIAASWWGKFKTTSQMLMIILLILNLGENIYVFAVLEQVFIWLALILTVISLVDYIVKNKQVIRMQE